MSKGESRSEPVEAADVTRRHGNFHDPFGLVRRMLASNQPGARAALVREAIRLPLRPLDWALGRRERRWIAAAAPSDLPVVLIVGAPRSGSTLLYQVLTAHLPVSFPSNLTELFPHAPITATTKLARLARRKVSYQSYYGNTGSLGSPNDAFSIWNRWFGADRYRIVDHLSAETGAEMRSFFAAWGAATGKPFMNKNNRNTAALTLLAAELPAARFVVVRRDPLFVVQSLVEARQTVQGDRRVPWGLGAGQPPDGDDYLADVADQVFEVESMLDAQLSQVDPARVQEVDYNELCADPDQVVTRVGRWLGLVPYQLQHLKPFASADRVRLGADEFGRLRRAVEIRLSSDDEGAD